MAITRWSPLFTPSRDLVGIQGDVNRLLDTFFVRYPTRGDAPALFTPAVDIEETPEEFVLKLDLPGVPQKDVKVSLMGDMLTVKRRAQAARAIATAATCIGPSESMVASSARSRWERRCATTRSRRRTRTASSRSTCRRPKRPGCARSRSRSVNLRVVREPRPAHQSAGVAIRPFEK